MQADRSLAIRGAVLIVGVVVALVLVITAIGWVMAFERTKGGEVAIIRNGGPFDNNRIRGYLPEASSRQNIGLWSSAHKHLRQPRFHALSSDAAESDAAFVDHAG